MKYNFKKIEPKWQAKWEESKVFEAKDNKLAFLLTGTV